MRFQVGRPDGAQAVGPVVADKGAGNAADRDVDLSARIPVVGTDLSALPS